MFPSIVEVIWLILPAWMANMAAIDVKSLPVFRNWNTPMDFGAKMGGKRILGDGKTWRGFFAGIAAAVATGFAQNWYSPSGLMNMTPLIAFFLGLGAVTGDIVESFIKRRSGLDRGHPLFLLDHLDYVFGAFFLVWLVLPYQVIGLGYLFMACFLTLPIHFFSNIIAWKTGLKKDPW